MSEQPIEGWEHRVQQLARDFPYPRTPDLAGAVESRLFEKVPRAPFRVRRRQLAWALAIILIVVAGLITIPPVRAAVLRVLRLGAVEIVFEPTPTVTLSPETSSATAVPDTTPLVSVLDLAGETSLAEARERVAFNLRLPAYPPDLGLPDRVFVQDLGGEAVITVWVEAGQPERARLSLHQLGPGTPVMKFTPRVIQETAVRGERALWTEGPYFLRLRDDYDSRRLIEGHVLIWTEDEFTYRLETDLPLEEAVRIAESLE